MASFEIGARDRLIPWREIKISPSTPSATEESGHYNFPVSFTHRGVQWKHSRRPDGQPFAIAYPDDKDRFCVLEIDLKTEQLKWSDKDRQTIERKFVAYLNVLENKTHESHLGFPDLNILFTTISVGRLESMMELLASIAPRFLNHFAFETFPTIAGNTLQPVDKGRALTALAPKQ
ncbi:hypothetical protein [Bradyrhizobium canariense]|uniref:hypothetical protein n=1 Tax=Bradyrhizobium canariense TaxID=255045 RepID=UPI0011778869|nr:hypothetical protein [Bradyrhizobium canariense]